MRILSNDQGRLVELHAGIAVALEEALDDKKQVCPYSLGAGIAAPGPADDRCDKEQTHACHDQQAGNIEEFLRPDLDEEEIETAVCHIDQHRLIGRKFAAIPANPGRDVVNAKRDQHDDPFQSPELAADPLGEDLFAGGIKRLNKGLFCTLVDRFDIVLIDFSLVYKIGRHNDSLRFPSS